MSLTVNHILEPIAEEPSFMDDDQLNNSIVSFQNFIEDDLEPQEFLDFYCSDVSSDSSDNKGSQNDDLDMGSNDESIEEQLQQLMPQINP